VSGFRNCGVRATLIAKVARDAFDRGTRRCRAAWFPQGI